MPAGARDMLSVGKLVERAAARNDDNNGQPLATAAPREEVTGHCRARWCARRRQ